MQVAPALPESIAAMLTSLLTAVPAAPSGASPEAAGESPAPTFSELLAGVEEEQESADEEAPEQSDIETPPMQAMPAQPQNIRMNTVPWHFAAPAFTAPETPQEVSAPDAVEPPAIETTETPRLTTEPTEGLHREHRPNVETTSAPPVIPEPQRTEHTGQSAAAPVPPQPQPQPAVTTFAEPVEPVEPGQPSPAPRQAQTLQPEPSPDQNTARPAPPQTAASTPMKDVEVPPSVFTPLLRRTQPEASEPEAMPQVRVRTEPVNAEAPRPTPEAPQTVPLTMPTRAPAPAPTPAQSPTPAPAAAPVPSEVQAPPVVYATPAEPAPEEKREGRPQPLPAVSASDGPPAEHVAFTGKIHQGAPAGSAPASEAPRAPETPQHIEAPRPVRLPPEAPEAPRTPLRTLTVTVEPQAGTERADIHFVHRNGVVDMAVRASNPELARVLRSDLPELVRDLEQQGFSSDLDSGEQHPDGRSRRQHERKDDDD